MNKNPAPQTHVGDPIGYLKPRSEWAVEPIFVYADQRNEEWMKPVFTVPVYAGPTPQNHLEPDFRALAVEIVDGIRGYTFEFSSHPAAHKDDYDFIEQKLRAALASEGQPHG